MHQMVCHLTGNGVRRYGYGLYVPRVSKADRRAGCAEQPWISARSLRSTREADPSVPRWHTETTLSGAEHGNARYRGPDTPVA